MNKQENQARDTDQESTVLEDTDSRIKSAIAKAKIKGPGIVPALPRFETPKFERADGRRKLELESSKPGSKARSAT